MIKYSKPLEQINNGKGKEQTLLINIPKWIEYEETHTDKSYYIDNYGQVVSVVLTFSWI